MKQVRTGEVVAPTVMMSSAKEAGAVFSSRSGMLLEGGGIERTEENFKKGNKEDQIDEHW